MSAPRNKTIGKFMALEALLECIMMQSDDAGLHNVPAWSPFIVDAMRSAGSATPCYSYSKKPPTLRAWQLALYGERDLPRCWVLFARFLDMPGALPAISSADAWCRMVEAAAVADSAALVRALLRRYKYLSPAPSSDWSCNPVSYAMLVVHKNMTCTYDLAYADPPSSIPYTTAYEALMVAVESPERYSPKLCRPSVAKHIRDTYILKPCNPLVAKYILDSYTLTDDSIKRIYLFALNRGYVSVMRVLQEHHQLASILSNLLSPKFEQHEMLFSGQSVRSFSCHGRNSAVGFLCHVQKYKPVGWFEFAVMNKRFMDIFPLFSRLPESRKYIADAISTMLPHMPGLKVPLSVFNVCCNSPSDRWLIFNTCVKKNAIDSDTVQNVLTYLKTDCISEAWCLAAYCDADVAEMMATALASTNHKIMECQDIFCGPPEFITRNINIAKCTRILEYSDAQIVHHAACIRNKQYWTEKFCREFVNIVDTSLLQEAYREEPIPYFPIFLATPQAITYLVEHCSVTSFHRAAIYQWWLLAYRCDSVTAYTQTPLHVSEDVILWFLECSASRQYPCSARATALLDHIVNVDVHKTTSPGDEPQQASRHDALVHLLNFICAPGDTRNACHILNILVTLLGWQLSYVCPLVAALAESWSGDLQQNVRCVELLRQPYIEATRPVKKLKV